MLSYTQADEVRDLVIQNFERYGAEDDDLVDMLENIMIDEGRYVARTYRTDHLMAMWMVQLGLVQFYDDQGNMLDTINLFQDPIATSMAA